MIKYITFLLLLCLSFLLIGCDSGMEVVGMEIVEFPHNIVYYAEHDTQLDLSGGKVKLTIQDGREYYHEMVQVDFFSITYSIDFNTEGVYVVEIKKTPKLYCKFPIQVIKIRTDDGVENTR